MTMTAVGEYAHIDDLAAPVGAQNNAPLGGSKGHKRVAYEDQNNGSTTRSGNSNSPDMEKMMMQRDSEIKSILNNNAIKS